MVMLIRGKSTCGICGNVLEREDTVVCFPAFLPADHPLHFFSDAAFHVECFHRDDRSVDAARAYVTFETIRHMRVAEATVVALRDNAALLERLKDKGQ